MKNPENTPIKKVKDEKRILNYLKASYKKQGIVIVAKRIFMKLL